MFTHADGSRREPALTWRSDSEQAAPFRWVRGLLPWAETHSSPPPCGRGRKNTGVGGTVSARCERGAVGRCLAFLRLLLSCSDRSLPLRRDSGCPSLPDPQPSPSPRCSLSASRAPRRAPAGGSSRGGFVRPSCVFLRQRCHHTPEQPSNPVAPQVTLCLQGPCLPQGSEWARPLESLVQPFSSRSPSLPRGQSSKTPTR